MAEGNRKNISCGSGRENSDLGEMYQSSFSQGTDWKSAFHQQKALLKQLEEAEANKRLPLKQIEEWPNTRLSGIKGDIPKHQPNKRSSRQHGSK